MNFLRLRAADGIALFKMHGFHRCACAAHRRDTGNTILHRRTPYRFLVFERESAGRGVDNQLLDRARFEQIDGEAAFGRPSLTLKTVLQASPACACGASCASRSGDKLESQFGKSAALPAQLHSYVAALLTLMKTFALVASKVTSA